MVVHDYIWHWESYRRWMRREREKNSCYSHKFYLPWHFSTLEWLMSIHRNSPSGTLESGTGHATWRSLSILAVAGRPWLSGTRPFGVIWPNTNRQLSPWGWAQQQCNHHLRMRSAKTISRIPVSVCLCETTLGKQTLDHWLLFGFWKLRSQAVDSFFFF